MKITATYARKLGMPGYGSISAGCSVEIDTKTTDRAKADEALVAAYSIATAAVETHLAAQLADLSPPDPDPVPEPEPEPEPAPRRTGPATNGHRRGGQDRDGIDRRLTRHERFDRAVATADEPADGRQLLAMIRRWGDEDETDYQRHLTAWAKREGHDWRVVGWDHRTVALATAYLAGRRPALTAASGRGDR